MQTQVLERPDNTTTDDREVHFVCPVCDTSLCGVPLPEGSEETEYQVTCIVCLDLAFLPCGKCGHFPND